MNSPQRSIWSSNVSSSLPSHAQSFNINTRSSDVNIQKNIIEDRREDLQKSDSPMLMCVRCCIIGSLLVGVVLVTMLTLYLISSLHKTTTTSTFKTTTSTPPCTPISVGSSSTLYTTTSGSDTSYTCHVYIWTSPVTGTVTLAFQLRHDPDYWHLDDVSVYHGASQMLINGGFETGLLSPWIRTVPTGNCSGVPGQVGTLSVHTGNYSLDDGTNGCADQIKQVFTVITGELYNVSFWLQSGSTGSVISAQVTLS